MYFKKQKNFCDEDEFHYLFQCSSSIITNVVVPYCNVLIMYKYIVVFLISSVLSFQTTISSIKTQIDVNIYF